MNKFLFLCFELYLKTLLFIKSKVFFNLIFLFNKINFNLIFLFNKINLIFLFKLTQASVALHSKAMQGQVFQTTSPTFSPQPCIAFAQTTFFYLPPVFTLWLKTKGQSWGLIKKRSFSPQLSNPGYAGVRRAGFICPNAGFLW